jgi:signal-transduction protein with cAMP-binding, CBS, and nucleotidyltransferase domain
MKRPIAIMMSKQVRTIPSDATLCDCARSMKENKVGAMLVERGGEFVGIVSETDLVRRGMAEGRDLRAEKVSTVMSSPLITIDIDKPAHDASDLMSERGIRHLVVTEGGRIVGVLSVRDLLRYYKNWGA